MLLYGISRFTLDFFRYYESDQVLALGLSNNQWISLGMMVLGLGFMMVRARAPRVGGGVR